MYKLDRFLVLLSIIWLPEPIAAFSVLNSSNKKFHGAVPVIFARQQRRISLTLQTTDTPLSSSTTIIKFEDLEWKLQLPENTSWSDRIQYRAKRWWDTIAHRNNPPIQTTTRLVTPRTSGNGQIVLEGYLPSQLDSKRKPVIRMGFTTQAGPSLPLHPTTLERLKLFSSNNKSENDNYYDENNTNIQTMALIFLWIDPQYRGLQWGIQAMRIVRYIHYTLGAQCTVIVANDKGSGRLVPWYEQQGFVQALELQECLGSPNQIYGTAMVGRTLADRPAHALVIKYSGLRGIKSCRYV